MARVRASARSRKSRPRLSIRSDARRDLFPRPVKFRKRRRSSHIDRNGAVTVAEVEELTPVRDRTTTAEGITAADARADGRRRSGRLLRRSSTQRTPSFLTPTTPRFNAGDASSRLHDTPNSALGQIELVPGDENKVVESMFGEVFDQASLFKVDVEQCISLPEFRVRPFHMFGIQRAIHLLRGESVGVVTGHVCAGKFPVVAEVPEEYQERILDFFCSKGRDIELSKQFISTNRIYQVVNGGYEHEGRWRLIDSSGYQFTGIQWRTVQIPWQEPKVLRAIAMMSSQVQKAEHVVELSFADEMVHLRRVIDDYLNETGVVLVPGKQLPRGFCKEISGAFCGGTTYSNNTLRHLISIATKMSISTALMIQHVIDEECTQLARSLHKTNSTEVSSHVIDTRVFRKLINSKTLSGAKKFFAPDTSDEDRKNALHRLRYMSQAKGNFKGIDPVSLDDQVEAAIAGRRAIDTFRIRILRNDCWPDGVKPLLRNILCTTKIDVDVLQNQKEPDELLQVLKHRYLECAGGEGGNRVEQYEKFILDQARRSSETPAAAPGTGFSTPPASTHSFSADEQAAPDYGLDCDETGVSEARKASKSLGASSTDNSTKELGSSDENSEIRPGLDLVPEQEQEPARDPLQECDVEVHGITWEEYNRTVLTEQKIFDFVISDPFQKASSSNVMVIDDEQRKSFVEFVEKVLVPGGYVFLVLPQLQVSRWLETFDECKLKPDGVFTLIRDPDSVQCVKGRSFQNLIEVAAIARKQGRHPMNFAMDVVSPYSQLPRNRYKRRAPLIYNISPPLNRLRFPRSKTLVRTAEKAPALFRELMKTFCPPGGKVFDPFAGTLTTGIACVQSGRSCVLLESDKQCLELAQARLQEIAVAQMEEIEAGRRLPDLGCTQDLIQSAAVEDGGGCNCNGNGSSSCAAGCVIAVEHPDTDINVLENARSDRETIQLQDGLAGRVNDAFQSKELQEKVEATENSFEDQREGRGRNTTSLAVDDGSNRAENIQGVQDVAGNEVGRDDQPLFEDSATQDLAHVGSISTGEVDTLEVQMSSAEGQEVIPKNTITVPGENSANCGNPITRIPCRNECRRLQADSGERGGKYVSGRGMVEPSSECMVDATKNRSENGVFHTSSNTNQRGPAGNKRSIKARNIPDNFSIRNPPISRPHRNRTRTLRYVY